MAKKTKMVHLNIDEDDHEILRKAAEALDMPLATYCKAIVLRSSNNKESHIECPVTETERVTQRKQRTITNRR